MHAMHNAITMGIPIPFGHRATLSHAVSSPPPTLSHAVSAMQPDRITAFSAFCSRFLPLINYAPYAINPAYITGRFCLSQGSFLLS